MGCKKLSSLLTFKNGYIGAQLDPAKGSESIQLLSSAGIQEITLSTPRNLRSDKPHQGNDTACTVSITLINSNDILELDGWISWQKKSKGQTELIGVILSETQTDSEASNTFKELTGYDAGIKPNGKKGEGTNYASFPLPVSGAEEYGAGQTIQGSADPPNCDELTTLFSPEIPAQPGTDNGGGGGANGGNECGEDNLLVNGDFSKGNFKDGANQSLKSIADWELTDKGEVWSSGFRGTDSTTGDGYFIELDAKATSGAADKIFKTIITEPGTIYDLSFDLRRRKNQTENVIVTWSDQINTHQLGVVDAGTTSDWVKQAFSFQATSETTTISLEEPGSENDSLGVLIDNINLTKACDQQTGNENNRPTQDPDAPVVTKIVGRNIVEAKKRELEYTVTLDKTTTNDLVLPFAIVKSDLDSEPDATPKSENPEGDFDYLDGISNVGITDNILNNGDGTITVPKGVKTFKAFVPIQADDLLEDTEVAILSVGDQKGKAFIFDSKSNTKVESVIGETVEEGDGQRMAFEITLSRPTQSRKRISYFFGNDNDSDNRDFAIAGINDIKNIDYLVGESDITIDGRTDNKVKIEKGKQVIRVEKGIQSFSLSVPIINDNEVENTEEVFLQVSSAKGHGYIEDNDDEAPLNITGIFPNSTQEGEERQLTYQVLFNKTSSEKEIFEFSFIGGENCIGGLEDNGIDVDYLNGDANNRTEGISFDNDVTITSIEDGIGTLSIPKGIDGFEVTVPVIDDTLAEKTEQVTLSISKEAAKENDKDVEQTIIKSVGQIFDNDSLTTDLQPISIIATSVQEGNTDENGAQKPLEYTIKLNQATTEITTFDFSVSKGPEETTAIGSNKDDGKTTDYLNGLDNVTFSAINENGETLLNDNDEPIFSNEDFTLSNNQGKRKLTIPAGISSFKASVPVIDDTRQEAPENATLIFGQLQGIGQIFDNDTITDPEIGSISGNAVQEGDENPFLEYAVKLTTPTREQTRFSYEVVNGSSETTAIGAPKNIENQVDYLNGSENVIFEIPNADEKDISPGKTIKLKSTQGNTPREQTFITIPKDILEFTVKVPVIDDTLVENTEEAVLRIGNETGTGRIFDNDSLSSETYDLKATSIQAASVKEGDKDKQGKQKPLEYTITLNQNTTAGDTLKFSVEEDKSNVNIAIGAEKDDTRTVDYLNGSNVVFSSDIEGVESKEFVLSEGNLQLPEGISRFTAMVPVIDDTRIENTETATLKIGDLQGIGQIFDNDSEVKAVKITPSSVIEGDGNPLKYEVTLNQRTTQDTLIGFSVDTSRANTAVGAPTDTPNEVDYLNGINNVTFNNTKIKNNQDNTITIPAGINSFTASVPVIDDTLIEKTETAVLKIGGLEGIGEIFDNDSQTLITNPEVVSIGASSVLEGDGNRLTYTITFNTALFEETKLGFSVSGTATGAPNDTPNVVDYLNGATNIIFTEGVTLSNGSATIPKGVNSFTASVPVIDDTLQEDTETAILKIGNLEGVGQIFDNDTVNPAIEALSINATSVQEGDGKNLVYTVLLNRTTTANTDLAFSVDGDAIGAATDTPNQVDYLNGANVTLSESVINNGNGTVTIPTGVSSFTATVPVIDDTLAESTEEAILTIGTLEGVGQIFDNDSKPVDLSVVSVYADAVQEGDGRNLTYTVQLNRQTTESSKLSFSVSGDAIGATADKPNEVDYLTGTSNVTLSNGVTSNGSGTITIPAGVISFTASVPVIDDTLAEDTETAVLSIGNLQGTGQIFDNDTGAEPVSITASSVTEGDGQNLTYTVALGQATTQATDIAFSVSGDAIGAAADKPNEVDYLNGSSNVTLSDGVTNNGNGTVTVPKGVTSFTASVPVIDDTLPEDTETAVLNVGRLEGIGQIFDNDQTIDPIASDTVPQIKLIQTNAVLEGDGNDLIYKVKLDRKPKKKLQFAFNISGDATFDLDYETGKNVTLTNGVKNKKPGSITIPAGVKSFKAKVPVIDDNLIEETETASIHFGRVSGIGQIFDNDSLKIDANNSDQDGSSESEGPQKTNPGSGDGDVLSTRATLSLTSNGNGLEVKGDKSSSLWLDLDVLYANNILQNNLVIVNRNGDGLGTLGSTPQPRQNVGSSFRGSKHLLLNAGDEIYFRQSSDNEPINEFPSFELERLDGKGFQLSLEDNRPDGGKDFNDLVVSIQPLQKPKDQELVEMAGIQRRTHDGLFDLSDLGKETTLTLTALNNTGGDVLIGLVPVTGSQGAGFSVDGKDPRDGQRFEKAIRDNLIDPEQDSEETSGKTITASWSLDADDAGLYAPVLITEDDDVMTFGRRFGSTSDQRLKVLGENVVGFELSAKDNRSDQEWHYDDVIVEAILG